MCPVEVDLDIYILDLIEPVKVRAAEPYANTAGAVPEADYALGDGASAAPVRGLLAAAGQPVPEAVPPGDRGEDGRGAAGAPSTGLQATGAGGQELRGDRGDHGREPGYGEEPAAQGAHELRGTDRT